jgi:hypothetical protein
MTKLQLQIAIIIVGLLVCIGLISIYNSTPHLFQIPVFTIIWESIKIAAEILFTLGKMIILGIWHFTTKSWTAALVAIGSVILFILWCLYERRR